MLSGQYQRRVNSRRQVAFPEKYKEQLGENLTVTQGFHGQLIILPENGWSIVLKGIEDRPFTDMKAQDLERYLFGNALEVKLDSQGRFLLPQYLKDHASIENDVLFVGVRNRVEAWNPKLWTDHNEEIKKNIGSITEKMLEKE